MRLAVDVRMLANSGIGTYLQNLLPRLISRRTTCRFHLIGNADQLAGHPWSQEETVSVISSDVPLFSVREQLVLPRLMSGNFDALWCPQFNIPLLYRGTLLATVHDVLQLTLPRLAGGRHKQLYARLLFKVLASRAHSIICVSRFTASELMRQTLAPSRRITVIYNGVDSSWFSVERKFPSPHPRPYILFVGNVKPNKNLPSLLRAYRSVSDKIPHDLVIVGKQAGFLTGDPAIQASASSMGGRVRFTGAVRQLLLQQFVVHAEMLVMPSFYEGFGLPPLEAMACGCPTIVSNAGALPEVCGDAALYCDPYDASDIAAKMVHLARSTSLSEELRETGRMRARQFSWDNCAAETAAVIGQLC